MEDESIKVLQRLVPKEWVIRHFVRVLGRLDIWAADRMGLFGWYRSEVQKLMTRIDAKDRLPGIAGCFP